ncbi:MAG: SMI1/KNR4 family protein [Fimbriiglobus sp.]
MDWTTVFDELYPEPGATAEVLEQYVMEVAFPMSSGEIERVNTSQQNPFPKSDPLYSSWQPFDPAAWEIPNRPLPSSYLSLLKWSNGGEFRTGERWFQFFPALDEGHGVRAMMLAYHLPEYMPGALPIAFNGGGTFYLFDMRLPAIAGEYPVGCAHAGYLSWDSDAYAKIADSFLTACRGTSAC